MAYEVISSTGDVTPNSRVVIIADEGTDIATIPETYGTGSVVNICGGDVYVLAPNKSWVKES